MSYIRLISTGVIGFLAGSPFYEDLDHIVRCFDKTTKLRFRDSKNFQYIKFGTTRDTDEKFNIRFGQLKLQGFASYRFTGKLVTHPLFSIVLMLQCSSSHRSIALPKQSWNRRRMRISLLLCVVFLLLDFFPDEQVPSMLSSLVVSQLAIGYIPMSRLSWGSGI